jgi:hypothetical protein
MVGVLKVGGRFFEPPERWRVLRIRQVGADQPFKVRGVKGFGRLTSPNSHLILPSPFTSTMPQTSLEAPSRFNYQSIFDSALEGYKKKTGNDLTKDPLLRRLETCDSPDAVLTILRAQLLVPGQSQSNSEILTTWLDPTVNVINAFSATVGGSVGLVSLMKIE